METPKVSYERLTDQPGNVRFRVYTFTNAEGQEVRIEEHSLGHEWGDAGVDPPHFNIEVDGVRSRIHVYWLP
jgi:hypothetical protein